jgi:hypothetical protein
MSHARIHIIRLGAVVLAAGVILGAAAGLAGAAVTSGNSGSSAVPTSLAGIKAKAASDITDRVNDLNGAIAKVNGVTGLGPSQATLVSYLDADISPLQQLNQTIQADSTVHQAAHDFGTIFSDYRVYVLVLPASRIAATADHATTSAIPNLSADAVKAQAHVTPANEATLQPLINDLNSQISAATEATNGLASAVLAFTPAQWNADRALLDPSRSSSQATTDALGKGRADVKQIAQDLRSSAGAGLRARAGSTTTTS